jgi:UDP-N-acetylglucosamine--N-acetylmuramyl-(pentapeptide) pyrophosphoryl-undecaprenol N-acetylglucosamine transferase
MTADQRVIVLAAGGTGGHLFPAQALAEVLVARGYAVHLMTDERVRDYGKNFPAVETHIVHSASLGLSDPLKLPSRLWKLFSGYRAARAIFKRVRPAAVVGFGGYPSFPPVLAAAHLHIPCAVHEQNAVLGRANKALSGYVGAIASSFPVLHGITSEIERKLVVTGNPVRAVAMAERAAAYPELGNGQPFNLVVFGGSQGARFFAEFMPKVFAALSPDMRARLMVTQQCRPEDLDAVRNAYQAFGLKADLQPFFMDMPKRIAACHLVVSRSGASTIAELGVIGRPAIMVPLPHALDNDQLRNAERFAQTGAGWIRPQGTIDAAEVAAFLTDLAHNHAKLKVASIAALSHGKPDAANRLADLTLHLAGEKSAPDLETRHS